MDTFPFQRPATRKQTSFIRTQSTQTCAILNYNSNFLVCKFFNHIFPIQPNSCYRMLFSRTYSTFNGIFRQIPQQWGESKKKALCLWQVLQRLHKSINWCKKLRSIIKVKCNIGLVLLNILEIILILWTFRKTRWLHIWESLAKFKLCSHKKRPKIQCKSLNKLIKNT